MSIGCVVALIGIKIRILSALRKMPRKNEIKQLEKHFCTIECKKDFSRHKKGCQMSQMGLKSAIDTTYGQIEQLVRHMAEQNPTMIPALINPGPLLGTITYESRQTRKVEWSLVDHFFLLTTKKEQINLKSFSS